VDIEGTVLIIGITL